MKPPSRGIKTCSLQHLWPSKNWRQSPASSASRPASDGDTEFWIPEYHTLSQIESFESHFRELGKIADDRECDLEDLLGFDELSWIDNEYRICAADYRYWSENYAFINANGKIVRAARRKDLPGCSSLTCHGRSGRRTTLPSSK